MNRNLKSGLRTQNFMFCVLCSMFCILFFAGCSGYSNKPLYSEDIKSVYVEMFENETFWRDFEYQLTDAVAKRIEAETPYKIVSDRSRADTVLSGKIIGVGRSVLTLEPKTGRPLEMEAELSAQFQWKNLKTGEYLLEDTTATSTATYSQFQQQSFDYAASAASNRLAERIVEQMQTKW